MSARLDRGFFGTIVPAYESLAGHILAVGQRTPGMRFRSGSFRLSALTTCLVAVQACGIAGPDRYSELGVIIIHGDTASITIPDTVVAGEPFDVLVETWGHGCTRDAHRTAVAIGVHVAEVLPYDWTSTGVVCPSDPAFLLKHDVSVQFDRPGHATVRIHGEELDEWGRSQQIYLDQQTLVR